MIVVFVFDLSHAAVPALCPANAAAAQAAGRWFAAAAHSRRSFFRSVATALDVVVTVMWLWLWLYTGAVATAVVVAMIMTIVAVIVAMAVVAAVAKTKDIVFVA